MHIEYNEILRHTLQKILNTAIYKEDKGQTNEFA